MPYDEFVRTRISEPLGMADTHFFLPPEKEPRRVVIHGIDMAATGWDKECRYVSASGGLSNTAADFLRFEQMLANGRTLFGKRLLSPESVATMGSNQVGELYQGNGKQPGLGFGYAVAVVLDPAAANSARGRATFGWGGAFGTTTWTDPELEITAAQMVQQGSETGAPRLRARHPRRNRRLKPRDYDFNAIISSRSPERAVVRPQAPMRSRAMAALTRV